MAITHLQVTRIDEDLVATWRGGRGADNVFVSDDPIDAGIDVRAPDGPGRAVIPGVPVERRVYVHVFDGARFVVGAERAVPSAGFSNLRDLGGYDTLSGRTRWGSVFRADLPRDEAAPATLARLGVVRVIDLRSASEQEREPSPLVADGRFEVHHLPVAGDQVQHDTQLDLLRSGSLGRFDESDMAEMYHRMATGHAATFARAARLVATAPGPVVFHCAGGKDRTGLLAAMILDVVGVERASVLDDYELTERYRNQERARRVAADMRANGLDPDAIAVLFGARRAVLRGALDRLTSDSGGSERLLASGGASPADIAGLRSRLLATDGAEPRP